VLAAAHGVRAARTRSRDSTMVVFVAEGLAWLIVAGSTPSQ
jgi:hypothetical protein